MKYCKKCWLGLVAAFTLVSCGIVNEDKLLFNKTIAICDSAMNPIIANCLNPTEIQVFDTLIFICEKKTVYPFIKVYSTNSYQIVGYFGQHGNGPNEYLGSSQVEVDTSLGLVCFFDCPARKFHGFSIRDVIDTTRAPFPKKSICIDQKLMAPYCIKFASDTSLILSTSLGDNLFAVIDAQGDIIDTLAIAPDKRIPIPTNAFNEFYDKYFVYSKQRQKVIGAYRFLDKLVLHNIKDKTTKLVYGENYENYLPKVYGEGNIINNHIGYFGLKESGDYLYALYMGGDYHNQDLSRNYPHEIQVFDWELKPLVKLTFPDPIIDFAVKDSMLYLLVANRPNPLLVYQLDKKAW